MCILNDIDNESKAVIYMQKEKCFDSDCECNKQQLQIKWNMESLNGVLNEKFMDEGYNPVKILKADTKNCISLCECIKVSSASILDALYNDSNFDEELLTLLLEYPEFYSSKYIFPSKHAVNFETFYCYYKPNERFIDNDLLGSKKRQILLTLAYIIDFRDSFIFDKETSLSREKIFNNFVNCKYISAKAVLALEDYYKSQNIVDSKNTCFVDALAAKNKQKVKGIENYKKFSEVVFKL